MLALDTPGEDLPAVPRPSVSGRPPHCLSPWDLRFPCGQPACWGPVWRRRCGCLVSGLWPPKHCGWSACLGHQQMKFGKETHSPDAQPQSSTGGPGVAPGDPACGLMLLASCLGAAHLGPLASRLRALVASAFPEAGWTSLGQQELPVAKRGGWARLAGHSEGVSGGETALCSSSGLSVGDSGTCRLHFLETWIDLGAGEWRRVLAREIWAWPKSEM